MGEVLFGYPLTADVLREVLAAVSAEFGGLIRDVFCPGEGKSVISAAGRFKYEFDAVTGHADAAKLVSILFKPDRKEGIHCMVILPVDEAYVGLIFAQGDDPQQQQLFQLGSKILVRSCLDRLRTIREAKGRIEELCGKYEKRTEELQRLQSDRERLEKRVNELNTELERLAHSRDTGDYAKLVKVANAYQQELRRVKGEFTLLVTNNGELVNELQELNAFCLPKMAEYESALHTLRMRLDELERQKVESEKAVSAASETTQLLEKARSRISSLQAEVTQRQLEMADQARKFASLRGEPAMAALQRRTAAAEEEAGRLRQALERMTSGATALKAKLTEDEAKLAKHDALAKAAADVAKIAASYSEIGFGPLQALEFIRAKLGKLL